MTALALSVEMADGARPASTWQLAAAVSLAAETPLDGTSARWFDAPPAHSWPHRSDAFSGSVLTGASCNCRNVQLTPHGSGTHTECVGHLTADDYHVIRVLPTGLLPALLIDVDVIAARDCAESADHRPEPGDGLISAAAIEAVWPAALPFRPTALIVRSAAGSPPPYLTRECAQLLVARGILHLVVTLPSLDRLEDAGMLTAHRIFFGLPPRSQQARLPVVRDAQRPRATVTELAHIPPDLLPGSGFLQIQAPALQGDAVPSRPLWFPLAERGGR
jgi:arylformamidase